MAGEKNFFKKIWGNISGKQTRAVEESNHLGYDPRVIKIEYPPSEYDELSEEFKRLMWQDNSWKMSSSEVIGRARLDQVLREINTRFSGKQIGLRGVLTSLDGDIQHVKRDNSEITVFDINHLLEDGVEQMGSTEVNIAAVGLAGDIKEIPDRVGQFFLSSIKSVLAVETENASLRDRIFPAVVVYDLGPESPVKKKQSSVNIYEYQLPKDPGQRSRAVVGVFPVDVRFSLPDLNK